MVYSDHRKQHLGQVIDIDVLPEERECCTLSRTDVMPDKKWDGAHVGAWNFFFLSLSRVSNTAPIFVAVQSETNNLLPAFMGIDSQ